MKKLKSLVEDILKEDSFKWKPETDDKKFESYAEFKIPMPATGDRVSGKIKERWEQRLTKLFGHHVDLGRVKKFYDGNSLDFEFELNGVKYWLYSTGAGSKSTDYVIQKYKKK